MLSTTTESTTTETLELPSQALQIPQLTMFTYPTRLANSWKPDILKIEISPYVIKTPKIEITVRSSSTSSVKFRFESRFRKIYRRFASPISLSGQYIFDARRDTDRNMAHILKNMVSGLLAAQKMMKIEDPITAILPANASAMAKNAYQLLGFQTLCTDRNVLGTLIETPSGAKGAYQGTYEKLFRNSKFKGYIADTPARVFISRKGTRNLLNEKEIEAVLQEYGFKKFYYEDIPVSEQWSISKNAKVVVGMHGAALSSLLFNRNSVKLVELFHPGYVTHLYRNIVGELGGSWCGVTGEMESHLIQELDIRKNARKFALSPTKIDPTSLRKALQYLGVD